jgi:glycosyltransferase XagB
VAFTGVGGESGHRVALRGVRNEAAQRSDFERTHPPASADRLLRDVVIADVASTHLARHFPALSAFRSAKLWPWWIVAACGLAFVTLTAPLVFGALLSIGFACLVVLRIAAITELISPVPLHEPSLSRVPASENLPTYSVLVPLYKEANIAARSVAALTALDYPRERLEILFLTEVDDAQTRSALMLGGLAPHMRIITVPDGLPRTKPRALNVGLQLAQGELIAVFDAEDVPACDQLRKSAALFKRSAKHGEPFSCLQARLDIDNANDSFWSRLFTLEYAALFGAILPALVRLGFALPLGGTSNHFRREDLVAVGGWDPFNVTEDADLGYRLARFGYRVGLVDSATTEEAPVTAAVWFGQRTRWLKGWMQTLAVHLSSPQDLVRDLGWWQTAGFLLTLGGMVVSALVHPLTYVLLLLTAFANGDPPSSTLQTLAIFNLVFGYAAGIALAALVAWQRRDTSLILSALLIPIYWLMISAAAYLALIDYIRRPFHWQKTPHGLTKRDAALSTGVLVRGTQER